MHQALGAMWTHNWDARSPTSALEEAWAKMRTDGGADEEDDADELDGMPRKALLFVL